MTQQIYNVNIFESDGNTVIYGPNASDAKKFLDNFLIADDQVIEKVEKIEDSSRQMVESLFQSKSTTLVILLTWWVRSNR